MKNSIAIDFDGVIADSNILKTKWIYNKTGIIINSPNKTNIYRIFSNKYSLDYIDKLYAEMSSYVFTEENTLLLNTISSDISYYLSKLKKIYNIYIVTNRPQYMLGWVREFLTKNKLDGYIEKILSSSNTTKSKICNDNNIDVLIDDDIRHLSDGKIRFPICFENDNIKDWNSLYDELCKINSLLDRKIITFFGPPCAGKSTMMEKFVDYEQIVVAQLLIDAGYDVKKGDLVSDADVIKIVLNEINKKNGNIILDGFPRTTNQLKALIDNNIVIDRVYNINTPYEDLIERAKNRLTCPKCHKSYTSNSYKPPIEPNICDNCGVPLVKRSDDELEVYEKRLEVYMNNTYPLLFEYELNNIDIEEINGQTYKKYNVEDCKFSIGIIWNSLSEKLDEATTLLSNYSLIYSYIDIDLSDNFEEFVWDVYGDKPELLKKRVSDKINYTYGTYDSRIIRILFMKPMDNIKKIKKEIRKQYSEMVDIYNYDNVFHMTENVSENIRMFYAIKKYISKINHNSNDSKVYVKKYK